MVKQTKPYGKADSLASPQAGKGLGSAMESAQDSVQEARVNGLPDVDAADSSAPNGHRPYVVPNKFTTLPPMGWKFGLITAGAIFIGIVVATTVFVLIRDSMIVSGSVDGGTAIDATMVCVDGTVRYADFSLIDRIVGNGVFACTDWKTTKRYTILPK